MGRKSHSNYIEAARAVLSELGGGPISSRDLVAAAQERGLVGDGKWVYHNFLRKVRESGEFDTSKRGFVSLPGTERLSAPVAPEAAPEAEVPSPEPVAFAANEETVEALTEDENPFVDTPA